MKTKEEIETELAKECKEANKLVNLHLSEKGINPTYLKQFSQVQERIMTLRWVLEENK